MKDPAESQRSDFSARTFNALILLGGLVLGQLVQFPNALLWAALVLSLIFAVFFRRRAARYTLEQPAGKTARAFILAVFFLIGVLRGSVVHQPPAPGHIDLFDSDTLSFSAIISRPPKESSSQLRFQADLVTAGSAAEEEPTTGRVIIVLKKSDQRWVYRDQIQVSGKLTRFQSSASNSYAEYLERQGVSGILYSPSIELISKDQGSPILAQIYRLRSFLLEKVYRIFPEPENALMAGILLGDESRIPTDIDEAFQRTGTAHVIAISGMNFSVLIWLLLAFAHAIHNRWWTPLSLLPFILFYTMLTGANPAIVRAGIMAAVALAGKSIGRGKKGSESLMLTAAIMGLQNPRMLFDVGFQLSVMATLGILLFNPPLNALTARALIRLFKVKANQLTLILNFLNEILITSISAQLLTVWIVAYAFNQIPWFSLLVNMLIAPFQTLIMSGGMLALIAAVIYEPFGKLLGMLLYPLPALTIRIVSFFGQFDWAVRYTNLSRASAWAIMLALLWFWFNRNRLRKLHRDTLYQAALGLLTLLTVMLWQAALNRTDRNFRLTVQHNANATVIELNTPGLRKVILAHGLTSYQAQDLMRPGFLEFTHPELAVLNFSESWMGDAFYRSEVKKPSLMYLDNKNPDLASFEPAQLSQLIFSLDDVQIERSGGFLKRNAWQINYKNFSVSIPNGIPPNRLDNLDAFFSGSSLILLTSSDDEKNWQSLLAQSDSNAILFSARNIKNLEIRSDGYQFWLNNVK